MAKRATAKTPTVAIARVLRDLGLKQGSDFRVRGEYRNGERVGTYVAALSAKADQVIADNADQIEYRVQQDGGFAFRVSIHFTAGGRMWTWVANYGKRTREAAPATATPTTGSDAPAEDSRKRAHELGATVTRVVERKVTRADLDALVAAWPGGTRVSGWDSSGKPRTGRVNGVGWGFVMDRTHPNYGRPYVDVSWDAVPGDMGCNRRSRPFADELHRI